MAATSPDYADHSDHSTRRSWAKGMSIFGGTMLATVGLFQILEGLGAVLEDKIYVTTPAYAYEFDISTWGWIHLVLGVIGVAVGVAILFGQEWAFLFGIAIASLSAIANFMFLPWYPIWAIVIVAFDLAVVWALCVRISDTSEV